MLSNFYCLSINDDRYNYLSSVFLKYGLPKPIKFPGYKNTEKKERCCLFGHMSIIMIARYLKLDHVFIFEDDAYPRKDILDKMNFYIPRRPNDCGILIFGRNGEYGEVKWYEHFHIVKERPFGAHAYCVYSNCYDDFLKSLERERIADIALRGNNFQQYKPYWTNDNLFIQKNLDDNCMSKKFVNEYGHYFYPNKNGGLGVFDKVPNENWE